MLSEQDFIKMWLDDKKPVTRGMYLMVLKKLTTFCDKPLKEIIADDLYKFKWSLEGLSQNTIKLHINVVRSLFQFGEKQEYFTADHSRQITPPKVQPRHDERMLTEEEVSAIILHTRRKRDALLIRFLYATGGRVSEVCALKRKNFKAGADNCAVTLFGKGDKERTIYFPLTLWQEMQELCGDRHDVPVFRSQMGGHLTSVQAWRIVRAAAKRAGIEGDVSPHWFRHSHASHALQNGASLIEVRDTLGHANIGVTDRYLHSKPGQSSSFHLKAL